jgi:IS30 family transposase
MLNMGQQYTILTLHKQGKTNAEIARQLHCNRHTVENILKRGDVTEKQTRHKPSAVTPYKEQIKEWLENA